MRIVDTFLIYQFIKRLVKPFYRWKAYKLGVIDTNGEIIVPKDERTPMQRRSLGRFDLLILNIKKILAKIPGGSTRLGTFAAALYLIKEDRVPDENTLIECIQHVIDNQDQYQSLIENAPVNNVGSGNVAGTDKPFVGKARVFTVKSDKVYGNRFEKRPYTRYSKYVGEDEEGEEIRQYCRNNPKDDVVLKDERTGVMTYLRRGKKCSTT